MNTGRLRRLLAGLTAVGSISGFLLGIEPAADPTASAVHAASAADEAAAAGAAGGRDYVGLVNPWVEADRGRFFFSNAMSTPTVAITGHHRLDPRIRPSYPTAYLVPLVPPGGQHQHTRLGSRTGVCPSSVPRAGVR